MTNFFVKPEDIIEIENKNVQECHKIYRKLNSQLHHNKEVNYLVFHIFAGHGWQEGGMLKLLTNEFNQTTNTYQDFPAEDKIRKMAKHFKNSYHIGVFACCR